MKALQFVQLPILSGGLFLLCSCTVFQAQKPATPQMAHPTPITIPVGKNWQVIEEAPNLSDERGRVPFQTEQSVQPAGVSPVVPSVGVTPVTPTDQRRIETPAK